MTYLFEVNIVSKLHVLGVDAENFETASWIGDTNVDFAIETTETTESGVNGVGTIGSSHYDNIRASLETIHKSKQLGDNSAFDFSVCL